MNRIKLFDVAGIPVYLSPSFIIVMVMLVMDEGSFIYGLTFAALLAASITLHELGHSLTARLFGYETRDITLSLLGGCASLCAMPRKAYQEFLVAAAGPAVSFLLSGVALCIAIFLPIRNDWILFILWRCYGLNLVLGIFNLLPGFPMDGGRIFRSTMRLFLNRAQATLCAMWVGRIFAVLLGLNGLYRIVNGGSWGVVSIFIAVMIWREGYREYLAAAQEERFSEWRARVSPPPYGGSSSSVDVN